MIETNLKLIKLLDIEYASLTGGSAITDILYVSPDGDNSNGASWDRAYTTIWLEIQEI